MKISVGDKVSFLNDKLEGTVRALVSDAIAKVEITDGFVVDALIKELVVTEKFSTTVKKEPVLSPVITQDDDISFGTKENTIAFVAAPAEINKVLTGNVAYYLDNKTDFELAFLFGFTKNGLFKTIVLNLAKPQSVSFLQGFSRELMIDWSHFSIQILIADDRHYFRPIVSDISILIPDLNTVSVINGNRQYHKSFVLADFNTTDEMDLDVLKDKFVIENKKEFKSPLEVLKNKKNAPTHGVVLLNTKEVDLHIEELIDDVSRLSNSEIINIQLSQVKKQMDVALLNNFKSIVFIHGVGNGKLKQAVLNELKNYHGITIKNGSYEKYGTGATEVLF